MIDRRTLILSAGFGVAATSLVKAKDFSFLDIPGDPLSARGLLAASWWATSEFNEMPGCRLMFANGDATGWHHYQHTSRAIAGAPPEERTYAVAIECCVTDENGKRFITSIPVNGMHLAKAKDRKAQKVAAAWAEIAPRYYPDEIPF